MERLFSFKSGQKMTCLEIPKELEFEYNRMLNKLEPVDRTEWGTPQTVNAYYNPTLNEIVFPALYTFL
jgi:predicted metalloendopeptidase